MSQHGRRHAESNDQIKLIFTRSGDAKFEMIPFPAGAYEVPDESGDSRPLMVLMSYDAVSVDGSVDAAPALVERIFKHKGADDKSLRMNRNALVFLVADKARKEEMSCQMSKIGLTRWAVSQSRSISTSSLMTTSNASTRQFSA